MQGKYVCDVAYKFHFGTPEGKEEACVKWFSSDEGDWSKCHDEAYAYSALLRQQGNHVRRMELLHTSSKVVKNYDV